MNDCPNVDIRDQLPDFLHDRLDLAEREVVSAHVRGCADCRDELALLRDMNRALHHAPAVRVGDIVAALPAYRTPAHRSWGAWKVAAAITLLAAGGASVAVARRGEGAHVESVRVAVSAPDPTPPVGVTKATSTSPSSASTAVPAVAPRELAVASGGISDLDERELTALLQDIETIDAVTSVEVEHAAPITPIAPSSPAGA